MVTGNKVKLRAIQRSDIDLWLKWLNDEEVIRFLPARSAPITREFEEKFYEKTQKSDQDMILVIETLEGRPIGNVGLHSINHIFSNAEIGIAIGEKDCWNKGYGIEAMTLMTQLAFNRLNLHRVYLHVEAENISAVKCYEKIGYRHEGRLREHAYNNGRYVDLIVMGVLRGELICP